MITGIANPALTKVLVELEKGTRMPDIRPGAHRDDIMYRAGMRHAFNMFCAKLNVSKESLRNASE